MNNCCSNFDYTRKAELPTNRPRIINRSGVFNVEYPRGHQPEIQWSNPLEFAIYQQSRMSNGGGCNTVTTTPGYHNYLMEDGCGKIIVPPKDYVRGYWPDERLSFTNTSSMWKKQ